MSDADTIRRFIGANAISTGSGTTIRVGEGDLKLVVAAQKAAVAMLAENERLRIAERAHYRTALENGQKLEAAQAENKQLRIALRELASWQPHIESALAHFHPQHVAAIQVARSLAAVPEERP